LAGHGWAMDHILSIVLFTPLLGLLALVLIPSRHERAVKICANLASLAGFLVCLPLIFAFDPAHDFQFVENASWIPSLGATYRLGIDGYGLLLVELTGLLGFLSILSSWSAVKNRLKEYYAYFLVLQVGMLGVFMSLDLLLFFVFWELVLVPMYFIIGIWGGPRRVYAAIKFMIYTLVGSVLMLLGILALYFEHFRQYQVYTFDFAELMKTNLSGTMQWWVFWAFFLGFAVKVPMWPLHTWLPDAHVEAPTAGSVLLAGLLLKMGGYGLIRVAIPSLPTGAEWMVPVMAVVAIASILYGAMLCLAQKDLKKMVAYSSISHMGFVLLGYATFTQLGVVAGVFQMFAHGLVTAVLFMMCGVVQHHCGTRMIPSLGGLAKKMPVAATLMTIGFLASLGLPGLVSFAAEFMVFASMFQIWSLWLFLPIISVAITAGYYLWALQRSMFGPLTSKIDTSSIHDANWFESAPVSILIVLIAVFGVLPLLVFQYIDPAVRIVISIMGGG